MYFCMGISGYDIAFFIPSILNDLGYNALQSQIHGIPVWFVVTVATLSAASASDLLRNRWAFLIFGCTSAVIGYILLLFRQYLTAATLYGTVFLAATGTYATFSSIIVWLANKIADS